MDIRQGPCEGTEQRLVKSLDFVCTGQPILSLLEHQQQGPLPSCKRMQSDTLREGLWRACLMGRSISRWLGLSPVTTSCSSTPKLRNSCLVYRACMLDKIGQPSQKPVAVPEHIDLRRELGYLA